MLKLNKNEIQTLKRERTISFNEGSNKIKGFCSLRPQWRRKLFIHFHLFIYLVVRLELEKALVDLLTGYFYFIVFH